MRACLHKHSLTRRKRSVLKLPLKRRKKQYKLYLEALLLWQQVPDPMWESALLLRLGRLNINLTEFKQANDYFSRALVAKKAIGDRRGEASALSGVCEALTLSR